MVRVNKNIKLIPILLLIFAIILSIMFLFDSLNMGFASTKNFSSEEGIGYFEYNDPQSNLKPLIEDDLRDAPYNQKAGEYDYSVVKHLKISGDMGSSSAVSSAFIRDSLNNLTELDLSTVTSDLNLYDSCLSNGSFSHVKIPVSNYMLYKMFENCPNLTTLVVGDGEYEEGVIDLTGYVGFDPVNTGSYGINLFNNCESITHVRILEDRQISAYMFSGCSKLTTLVAGNGEFEEGVIDLTGYTCSLKDGVFGNCTSITHVRIADVRLENTVFAGCCNLTTLIVGDGVFNEGVIDLTGYTGTDSWYTGLIGSDVFLNCDSISYVRIPAKVNLSSQMFERCSNLTTLAIGDAEFEEGVIDLRGHLGSRSVDIFAYCSSITHVRISADEDFGDNSFYSCSKLGTLSVDDTEFTEGVIDLRKYTGSIGSRAFSNCTSIRKLWSNDVKEYLGDTTFRDCSNLAEIRFFQKTAPKFYSNARPFSGVSETGTIYYPADATGFTKGAFASPDLDEWTFSKVYTVPSAPIEFKSTLGNGVVSLTWGAPLESGISEITNYEVSSDGGLSYIRADSMNSHTFVGLTNGKSYTFKVRAINSAGEGESAVSKAKPATVPVAPTDFSVTPGNTQVILSWKTPENGGDSITAYEISFGPTTDYAESWTPIPNSGEETNKYTIERLTNDIDYTFEIRAVNGLGSGESSGIKSATPKTPPPPAEYRLTVNNGTGSGSYAENTVISIVAYMPVAGKVFDKWVVSGGGIIADPNNASTTFTISTENVIITAVYKAIQQPAKPPQNVDNKGEPPKPIKKVTGIKSTTGKKKLTVKWKRDSNVSGYEVVIGTNKKEIKKKLSVKKMKNKKNMKFIVIKKNQTVKKTFKNLKKGKVYYIKIRSYVKINGKEMYGKWSKTKKTKKIK